MYDLARRRSPEQRGGSQIVKCLPCHLLQACLHITGKGFRGRCLKSKDQQIYYDKEGPAPWYCIAARMLKSSLSTAVILFEDESHGGFFG